MHDIDDAIGSYLLTMEAEGKTAATLVSYSSSLRVFRALGREIGLPQFVEDYGVEDAYRFVRVLYERSPSAQYQRRRHAEIRPFFTWCQRIGWTRENVFARVPLVQVTRQVREPFARDEVAALLSSVDRQCFLGARDYALLLFLLDTGVRASECAAAGVDDVDWTTGKVLIRQGKGHKQRLVAMSPTTVQAVSSYIGRYRGWDPGPIFIGREREPLAGPGAIGQIVARIGKAAGVPKTFPHRFRHTFATWAIESGAREIDVQLLLGHTTMTMTRRYANSYTTAQAVGAHERLSPVTNFFAPAPLPALPAPAAAGGVSSAHAQRREPFFRRRSDRDRGVLDRNELREGARLSATHKGRVFTCEVVERNGELRFVREDGARFESISAAARSITGTQVNGYRFWSLASPVGAG